MLDEIVYFPLIGWRTEMSMMRLTTYRKLENLSEKYYGIMRQFLFELGVLEHAEQLYFFVVVNRFLMECKETVEGWNEFTQKSLDTVLQDIFVALGDKEIGGTKQDDPIVVSKEKSCPPADTTGELAPFHGKGSPPSRKSTDTTWEWVPFQGKRSFLPSEFVPWLVLSNRFAVLKDFLTQQLQKDEIEPLPLPETTENFPLVEWKKEKSSNSKPKKRKKKKKCQVEARAAEYTDEDEKSGVELLLACFAFCEEFAHVHQVLQALIDVLQRVKRVDMPHDVEFSHRELLSTLRQLQDVKQRLPTSTKSGMMRLEPPSQKILANFHGLVTATLDGIRKGNLILVGYFLFDESERLVTHGNIKLLIEEIARSSHDSRTIRTIRHPRSVQAAIDYAMVTKEEWSLVTCVCGIMEKKERNALS